MMSLCVLSESAALSVVAALPALDVPIGLTTYWDVSVHPPCSVGVTEGEPVDSM